MAAGWPGQVHDFGRVEVGPAGSWAQPGVAQAKTVATISDRALTEMNMKRSGCVLK
jgi:hypothetical protein